MRIWHLIFRRIRRDRVSHEAANVSYELAYEAHIACDLLRFAIKQLESERTYDAHESVAMSLLDAYDRLSRAEHHFRMCPPIDSPVKQNPMAPCSYSGYSAQAD